MSSPASRERVSVQVSRQTWNSRLAGPIGEMPFLRRSLLFAELSAIAYMGDPEVRPVAAEVGFVESAFFERDGAQAYIFTSAHDTVVACRGTEPNDWNDIRADANAVAAVVEAVGRVHSGFNQEVEDLWPLLEQGLLSNTKPLWFTGHSLGGAMATLCAGRCKLSKGIRSPEGLYTFGSPRVGDRQYVHFIKLEHFRWVNNNDIVTRVPPTWMGYRHSGTEIYLNTYGEIRRLTGWQRTKDRWRGFLRSLREGRVDPLSDHSIVQYLQHICTAIAEEEGGTAGPVAGPFEAARKKGEAAAAVEKGLAQ